MKSIACIVAFYLLSLPAFGQKPELVVPIGNLSEQLIFSPNGKYLLSWTDNDPTVRLWDWYGHELQSFRIENSTVRSAHFSRDGQAIFIGMEIETPVEIETEFGADITYETLYSVRPWKLDGGEFPSFAAIETSVRCADILPDGPAIIAGASDGSVKVWTPAKGVIQSFKAHDSGLTRITASPDGRYVITESTDYRSFEPERKLWDLRSGTLVRALPENAYYTFTPNSRSILQSNRDQTDTHYLTDLQGQAIRTLTGASRITFSPDNRFYAAAVSRDTVGLWDLESGKLRMFAGTDISFSPNSRFLLVTSPYMEKPAMLWDLETENLQQIAAGGYIRFSSDGQFLMYNDRDPGAIQLLDLYTGERSTFASTLDQVHLLALAPAQDLLLALESDRQWTTYILYDLNTQDILLSNRLRSYAKSMSNAFISNSGTAIVTDRIWDLKTNTIQPGEEERPPYTHFTGDVLWSPQRDYIFGTPADGPTPELYPQTAEGQGASFEGHTAVVVAASFSADGRLVMSGSMDNTARLWNLRGECLQTFSGHGLPVWSVSISPDQQLYLTGTDQMAKLWQPDRPEALISLIRIDSADWIATTPSGLFDASQRAMQLMHYSLFYERDQEYVVIDIEQLKARYYEPGLLQKVLGYTDDQLRPVETFETVKLYPKVQAEIVQDTLRIDLKARNGGIGKVSIFINGKEIVEEVNPLPRRENARRDSTIRFDLKPHQNYLLRHPDSTNIISIRAYNEEGWLKSRAIELEYKVTSSRARGSSSQGDGSAWIGELDPKLYVISIGTSDYAGSKLDLQYADQDATMMARALQSVGAALFTNGDSLEVHCLTTAGANSTGLAGPPIHWQYADKKNIQLVFEQIKRKAKAEDVLVVYLSGHGVTYGSAELAQFHYLTQGIASEDLSDAGIRQTYTISSEELTRWINDIPALKQVLIIDACNSGQIVENLTGGTKALNSSQIRALDRMKDRTGMFVLSGSASDKVSYEAGEYGQGLLTYALLEGMRGVATRKDTEGQEIVDVMKLFQHARDRVPELAATINGVQTPMLGFPGRGASFDIGILDENAKGGIPIGNKKPVLVKSFFLDQNTFQDDLRLAELLEAELRQETKKGSAADLIYVDVYDYPGAYSLSGLYTVTEGEIKITVKLFRDRKDPVELELRPSNDPKRLVQLMVREIKRIVE